MFNYIKLFSLQYQAVSIRTQEEHFSTITGTISKEQIQEKVLAVCKAFDKINAEKVHVLIDWFFFVICFVGICRLQQAGLVCVNMAQNLLSL